MHRFIYFAVFVVASAQVHYDGPCPPAKPMDNFDYFAWQGTWYEIARYPNPGQEGGKAKCTTAQYFVEGNNGKARNTHVIAGMKHYIDGSINLFEPGVVKLTYTFGGRSKDSFLTVLKTDYSNFFIGYSCRFNSKTDTHTVTSWILSRSKVLDPNSLAIVNNFVEASPLLEAKNYVFNDFSEAACTYNYVKEIQEFLD